MNNITIEVHHNYMKIFPFTKNKYDKNSEKYIGTSFELEKNFMEYVFIRRRLLHVLPLFDSKYKNILLIPIGFGLKNVIDILSKKHELDIIDNTGYTEYDKIDISVKEDFRLKDEVQRESCLFLKDTKYYQKYLKIDTGKGKTSVTISHICNVGVKTLILGAGNLNEQWMGEFLTHSTIKMNEMFFIKGKESIQYLLKLSEKDRNKIKVYLGSIKTLINYEEKNYNGKNKPLEELFSLLRIGIKVYDEAHLNFKAIYFLECRSNIYETIFLSATPERSRASEDNIYKRIFGSIPSYGENTLMDSKHYDMIYINFISSLSSLEKNKCFGRKDRIDLASYSKYLFSRDRDVKQIFMIIIKFLNNVLTNDKNAKIIIVIPSLSSISIIKQYFSTYTNLSVGEYTSNFTGEVKSEDLNNSVIISTYNSCGYGLNVPNLRMIFNLTPMTSRPALRQIIGRLRKLDKDRNVYYVDIIDSGVPRLMDMFKKRRDILFRRGAKSERIFKYSYDENINRTFLDFLKDDRYSSIIKK